MYDEIDYDLLDDKEKEIINNPMYTRNVELINLILPGIGYVYMDERNKGVIIFIVYVLLFILWYLKLNYMEYIIFTYYIIQFGLSVFVANNKINKILEKGSKSE
ncbi:MAG: hypothetical protein ACI37V_01090 [Methanobrevibacter sp.]